MKRSAAAIVWLSVTVVSSAADQPKVYGTQFTLVNGQCKPRPLEDEANVDTRRKEVGLPPLAEYFQQAERLYVRGSKK